MVVDIAAQIVTTLANGAIAGTSGVASMMVKDAYDGLKKVVGARFGRRAALESLEEDPSSAAQKAAAVEALEKSGAAGDREVQELAQRLGEALAALPAQSARAMGLDIEDLSAASVRLSGIVAEGTAVHIRRTTVTGSFEADHIQAGQGAPGKN